MNLVVSLNSDVLIVPLIQEDFADILGISVIHVLRTFKRLAEAGAVEYRSRRLILLDPGKLRRIAGFDDPVPISADAPVFDRLLAYTGRHPAQPPLRPRP